MFCNLACHHQPSGWFCLWPRLGHLENGVQAYFQGRFREQYEAVVEPGQSAVPVI